MGKEMVKTEMRDEILSQIVEFLKSKEYDVLDVGSGEIAVPTVDKNGEEGYAKIKVSIPRGTRENGTYKAYNAYEVEREWKEDQEAKALEKKLKAKNKAKAEAEKEKKREMRTRKVKETDLKKMASQIAVKDNE